MRLGSAQNAKIVTALSRFTMKLKPIVAFRLRAAKRSTLSTTRSKNSAGTSSEREYVAESAASIETRIQVACLANPSPASPLRATPLAGHPILIPPPAKRRTVCAISGYICGSPPAREGYRHDTHLGDLVHFRTRYAIAQIHHAAAWNSATRYGGNQQLPTRSAWRGIGPDRFGNGLEVGFVRSGNPHHRWTTYGRAGGFAALETMHAVPAHGARWFALQQGTAITRSPQNGMSLVAVKAHGADFADAAAIIDQLNLVNRGYGEHLSRALRRPAWVLLSNRPDWRRQLPATPLRRTRRLPLFRQSEERAWRAVAAAAVDLLHKIISTVPDSRARAALKLLRRHRLHADAFANLRAARQLRAVGLSEPGRLRKNPRCPDRARMFRRSEER